MLFVKEKVLTREDVKRELEKIDRETALKGIVTAGGIITGFKMLNIASPVIDGIVYNGTQAAINKTAFLFSKKIIIPYVFSFTAGWLYLGGFTLIALLVSVVAISEKFNGEEIGTIIFHCACAILPFLFGLALDIFLPVMSF